jgi:urease accessory protein
MSQPPLLVVAILPRGDWPAGASADRVLLDHDARHRRRFTHVTEGGIRILIDLPQATVLADGDGLRLADGRLVAVEAAAEALMEVTAPDAALLLRLAWHVGNRHLPTELRPGLLRLREDHVIAAMLRGLGATVVHVDAPFSPESGAYAGTPGHGHDHAHGHHHHHDDHDGHGHKHGHDHGHDHGHGHHHHGPAA